MEILICTDSEEMWNKLFSLTDKCLCKHKARYISVYPRILSSESTIFDTACKMVATIVMIDVQAFSDWQNIAEQLEKRFRNVRICLISNDMENAVTAINCLKTLCGYICKDRLAEMCLNLISRICNMVKTICGGLAVTHYSSIDKVIPFNEIFFIETIKQTHMCNIVHKNGSDEIRADISKLINELPVEFQVVCSSTIANISAVKSFSDCELSFGDGISCFCSKRNAPNICKCINQTVLT